MKKSYLLLFGLLFSCNNSSNVASSSYKYSLSSDLNELILAENVQYDESFPFNCKANIVNSNVSKEFYIVTVTISYKSCEIDDFRCIAIPLNFTLQDASNMVANVGYDESFKLSSESNDELLSFPGYRISYLTKYNEIGVKVLVKGINIDYKFVFDSFTE